MSLIKGKEENTRTTRSIKCDYFMVTQVIVYHVSHENFTLKNLNFCRSKNGWTNGQTDWRRDAAYGKYAPSCLNKEEGKDKKEKSEKKKSGRKNGFKWKCSILKVDFLPEFIKCDLIFSDFFLRFAYFFILRLRTSVFIFLFVLHFFIFFYLLHSSFFIFLHIFYVLHLSLRASFFISFYKIAHAFLGEYFQSPFVRLSVCWAVRISVRLSVPPSVSPFVLMIFPIS